MDELKHNRDRKATPELILIRLLYIVCIDTTDPNGTEKINLILIEYPCFLGQNMYRELYLYMLMNP